MNTAIDLYLDLVKKPDPTPMVYAKQNDVQTRMLRLHLTENGRSWPIPESARPALIYRKADGTGGSFDTLPDGTTAFSVEGDVLTLTLAPQMLTCEGMVKCQLVLLTDSGRLSAFSWRMYVEHDLAQSGPSEDYYRLNTLKGLQEALDALGDDLAGLQGNNALEIDLSQDFAASGLTDPVQYFLNNADAYENNALLRLVHDGSVYTARCIHTHPGGDGCQYVEITDYGDDGFVEKYVYCNGELETNIGYAAPATGGKAPYLSVKAAAEAVDQVGRNTKAIAEASAFITEAQNDIHDLYGITTGLNGRLSALEGSFNVENWADVQKVVRAGLASRYFAIGDQLQCKRGDKVLTWDVIGIDHDAPADPQWSHSMTLQLHDVDSALQFDGKEALFFAEDGLDAGDYWFFLSEHPWVAGNTGKYFSFTLTQPVPAGGQLVLRAAYAANLNGSAIDVYENGLSAFPSETATLTMHDSEPAGGTSLGAISAAVNGNCNCVHRALVGSAHYPSSAIRQYLNSDAGKGGVWTPQGKFDRPASWDKTSAGFLHGADPDFVAALGTVEKTTTQIQMDGGGTKKTTDLVWLPSRAEVYAGEKLADEEGTAYAYYADQSGLTAPGRGEDANRVKYLDGAAKGWLLRTASGSSNSASLDIVGKLVAVFAASAAYGVAPCVCIV